MPKDMGPNGKQKMFTPQGYGHPTVPTNIYLQNIKPICAF